MNEEKSGFLTSEFWMQLAAIAGKIVTLLIMANVIQTANGEELSKSVTNVVLAIGTIVSLTYGANKYGERRTRVKVQAMQARMFYAQTQAGRGPLLPPQGGSGTARPQQPPRQPGVRV